MQRFVFVYYVPLGTVFTAFKQIMLFVSLEKMGKLVRVRVELGLGLGSAKVVGFTAFKSLKLLVSLKKRASCSHCSFHLIVSVCKFCCLIISFTLSDVTS